MKESLWLGILLGISAAFSVGPIFILIIEEAMKRGFKSSLGVIIGSAVADFILLIPAFVASWLIAQVNEASFYVGIVGASFFIYLGMQGVRDAYCLWNRTNPIPPPTDSWSFWKGVLGNIANPLTWSFWIVTGTPTILRAYDTGGSVGLILFIVSWFIVASGIEVIIAYTVNRTRRKINVRGHAIFTLSSSVIFFFLAFRLFQPIVNS